MASNGAVWEPFWLISKHENARMVVLTIERGDGATLPVFSHEEEAETYLWLAAPGTGWRARKTKTGELISVLYGPCAAVKKVALDPLLVFDDQAMDLVSIRRERFVRSLTDERVPSASRQIPFRLGVAVGFGPSGSSEEKGTRTRENRERREERAETEARHELRKILRLRRASYAADDVIIPDYVMRDFGSPDGSHEGPSGQDHASESPGLGEGFVRVRE